MCEARIHKAIVIKKLNSFFNKQFLKFKKIGLYLKFKAQKHVLISKTFSVIYLIHKLTLLSHPQILPG